MGSTRLATLNPVDVLDLFNSDVPLRNRLGEKTRDGEQVRALSLSNERQHALITNITGLEVVVDSVQTVRKTDLMDGRSSWDNELTIYAADFAESLSTFDVKLQQRFGLENVTKTVLANGNAYATAIGATAEAYFSGVVEAASYKLITGSTKYLGTTGDITDAPSNGANYVRSDGAWKVFNGSGGGSADSAGYFYQNSGFYEAGGHAGNADVQEDVEAQAETTIKFSGAGADDSDILLPAGVMAAGDWYNPATGIITIKGVDKNAFILIRVNCDIDPDTDESQAELVLKATANGTSGAYTFEIRSLLVSMDQGAERDYSGLVNVPIFIGDGLEDDGSTQATIEPCVVLTNTDGDLKPVSLSVYLWT